MITSRRTLLLAGLGASLAAGAAAVPADPPPAAGPARRPWQAVAFDGFPIFDLRPVAALTEEAFPGRGDALTQAWRARQFQYQWLRALSGSYADFRQTTEDSLVFAARSLGLPLDAATRDALTGAFLTLGVWPDVAPALQALRAAGLKLAIVSNMTQPMLDHGLERTGLQAAFDQVLSTDSLRTYKPSPAAYRMGVDALRLPRERILFAPFAGWDAAGAKAFGHGVFWINRLGAPAEELGAAPDGSGRDMAALLRFVQAAG